MRISEVVPRRAGLVLRWVTVWEYIRSLYSTKASRPTHPGQPFVSRRTEYTGDDYGHAGKQRRLLHNSIIIIIIITGPLIWNQLKPDVHILPVLFSRRRQSCCDTQRRDWFILLELSF